MSTEVHDPRLPGGVLEVDTDDPKLAAQAAQKFLARTPQQAAPQAQSGMGSSFMGRVGQGALDAMNGIAQLNTNMSPSLWPIAKAVNRGAAKGEAEYQDERKAAGSTGFDWGRLLGNAVSPVNAAAPISLPSKIGSALLSGGAFGALQPVTNAETIPEYADEKAKQVGLGAASAPLGYGGAKIGSALLNPVYSKAKQTLLDSGVPLTIGQTLGGIAKTTEDAATSIPIVGNFIKARQRDSLIGLNRAAINESLKPIGSSLPADLSGHEAVEYASDKLGDAYDTLLPRLSATVDQKLQQDIAGLTQGARSNYLLPDAQASQFDNILREQMLKSNSGHFDGDTLKNVQSVLRKKAADYIRSADPDQRSLGQALMDARGVFNDFITRNNPTEADALNQINQGWANFTRVRSASAGATTGGVFTPAQLGAAVRKGAATQGQTATGNALMQDLATAGKDVLPSTVPDSGTATRGSHVMALAAALAGGEHYAPEVAGPAIAGIAGASALYSKPVQSLLRTLLTQRPDVARKLGQALLANPGVGGVGGAAAALPVLQNGVAQ